MAQRGKPSRSRKNPARKSSASPPPASLDSMMAMKERLNRTLAEAVASGKFKTTAELEAFLKEQIEKWNAEIAAPAPACERPLWDRALEAIGVAQQMMAESNLTGTVVALLRAAVLDPENVDVQLMAIPLVAEDDSEQLELLQVAVKRAASALGEDAFRDLHGHFWGHTQTRPYMRARQHLLLEYQKRGLLEDALREGLEMLELNPGDNQGMRFLVVALAQELGHHEAATQVLGQYEDDCSSYLVWSKVLDRWIAEDAAGLRDALAFARKYAPKTEKYLQGSKAIPKKLQTDGYLTAGGEDEAIDTAKTLAPAWRKYPGAAEWLRQQKP
ncbi:hypothetical protein HZA57_04675 [Candidatus Poribacteria bacterium]|nr:hypothetical protein [Candidatus Poribacteria bacterium]